MLSVWAIPGIPEITTGDDLAGIICEAIGRVPDGDGAGGVMPGGGMPDGDAPGGGLCEGDIISVTSKVVSKAEGRFVPADDREEAITAETVRVVASRAHPGGITRIVENRLGLILAAAGVDSSNTPDGFVLLLPVDPDASARELCTALRLRFGVAVGVIITDTLGRPWREGQTDVAIGAAGIRVMDDVRGSPDAGGRTLSVTLPAVADEIAGATDLVKGKSSGLPVAIVRGLGHLVADLDEPGARTLVRSASADMFRLGSDEAFAAGIAAAEARQHE